ncbi:MAG: hypothetical protein J2P39_07615, partial [Candidatus Dormibacteraeota bacterium]|nr:hypothetical protein [Candidatus Dormibacteraeota bacterium]
MAILPRDAAGIAARAGAGGSSRAPSLSVRSWLRRIRTSPEGESAAAPDAEPTAAAARRAKERDPARWLDILACPACRAHPLRLDGEALVCGSCHTRFRIVDGVPVLREGDVKVMPVDHVSNALSEDVVRWLSSLDGLSLNVGAGA